MIRVNVAGGTNAGRKRPLRPPPTAWTCRCGAVNRGYHARCLTAGCNTQRPKEGTS